MSSDPIGHPFSHLGVFSKAAATVQMSRLIDESNGFGTRDASLPGTDINGRTLPLTNAKYDYDRLILDGVHVGKMQRVEVKCAKPRWAKQQKCWTVRFMSVKFGNFDNLVLIAHLPWCIEVWE